MGTPYHCLGHRAPREDAPGCTAAGRLAPERAGSREDVLAGDLADRGDGRVADLALDGDGVEPLADRLGAADEVDAVAGAELVLEDVGRGEHAEAGLAERAGERAVV